MNMAVHRCISHDDGLCYKSRIEQCQTSPIYTTATRNAEEIEMKGYSKERRKEWEGWVEGDGSSKCAKGGVGNAKCSSIKRCRDRVACVPVLPVHCHPYT